MLEPLRFLFSKKLIEFDVLSRTGERVIRTRTEKSWRTARIKLARFYQLQQAFQIRIKRQVSRYFFALLSLFYASYTYKLLERKVKCASHGCSAC